MKTRQRQRGGRNILNAAHVWLTEADGTPKPGVTVTGIADLKGARVKAVKALKCRAAGARRGDDKAREQSLWPARFKALTPLAEHLYMDTTVTVTRDWMGNRLWHRLWQPIEDVEREIAERTDLWPDGLPSRSRFREMIVRMNANEWAQWAD